MSSQVEKHILIFDGTHFRALEAQMTAFLQSQGLWDMANGTWTCPTLAMAPTPSNQELDTWDLKDEICNGQLTLHLAQNVCTGIVSATAALTWTNLQMQFASGGISLIYQDFKAVMTMKIGISNPAKDMTSLYTYLECFRANQVVIPEYIQGMMLLNAIPNKWDHVTAYYVQQQQMVNTITFTAI